MDRGGEEERRRKRRKIFEEGKYSIREVEDNIWALEEKKNGDRKRIKDLREGKNVNGGRVEIKGPTRGPCNLNQSLNVFGKKCIRKKNDWKKLI